MVVRLRDFRWIWVDLKKSKGNETESERSAEVSIDTKRRKGMEEPREEVRRKWVGECSLNYSRSNVLFRGSILQSSASNMEYVTFHRECAMRVSLSKERGVNQRVFDIPTFYSLKILAGY